MAQARDFVKDLREQLDFLTASMAAFDAGREHEAKRIATTLRVLLHDEGQTALLAELEARDDVAWLSLAGPFSPENMLPSKTLVSDSVLMTDSGPVTSYVPHSIDYQYRHLLPFHRWWNGDPVIHSPAEDISFTRRDLVQMAANRDGGAHVGRLDGKQQRLTSNALTPWSVGNDTIGYMPHQGSPVPASLRTIADEVLQTIGRNAGRLGVADGFTRTPRDADRG